jgi:hypothetical protein
MACPEGKVKDKNGNCVDKLSKPFYGDETLEIKNDSVVSPGYGDLEAGKYAIDTTGVETFKGADGGTWVEQSEKLVYNRGNRKIQKAN